MSDSKDYYSILGTNKNATDEEIKSAYRKMAKKYHPDLNPGNKEAAEKLKEVNEAYSVLGDATKKKNYDTYGTAEPGGFGGFGGNGGGFSFNTDDLGGFGDFFSSIFGGAFGGGRRQQNQTGPQRGQDKQIQITISLVEAAFGCKKEVTLTRNRNCEKCKGTGAKDGKEFETCKTCGGTGRVQTVQNTMFGRMMSESVCPDCKGTGKKIKVTCDACNGKGFIKETKVVTIDIPGGIENGQVINVSNEGEAGRNGGPNGSLLVVIAVTPHKSLKRKGSNIYAELEVSVFEALKGTKKQIDGINEKIDITIPECTQPESVLIVRGKGTKVLNRNSYGDMFVTIHVKMPKSLDRKQRKILESI